ncbi:DUF5908 family protein [Prosthecobacter sp.]|jgi:hypothetical protein|uniref:DUF5908 family protein n=1 Tax=Prosthecobacter sp. TaxID=1965333 RepID=UPI0037C822AB
MPIELRELIIQARIEPASSASSPHEDSGLTPAELQKIIDAVMERVEERLAEAQQR